VLETVMEEEVKSVVVVPADHTPAMTPILQLEQVKRTPARNRPVEVTPPTLTDVKATF
jgi:hypothetical protein